MSLLLALITAMFWATGDIFFGLTARKIGAKLSFFLILSTASLLMFLPGVYLFPMRDIDPRILIVTLLISVVHFIGTFIYIISLEKGNAIINGVIAGSFSIVTIIVSVLLFNETVMPIQIFAILLTIIGIIFSAFNFQKIAMKNIFSKGSFFALVTMVLWGAYFSLVKIPTQLIGWYWPAFMIRVLVILFIPLLISQKNLSMSRFATKKLFVFILAAAVLSGFGDVIYNLGISHSDISYFSPIASASPIFYAVIASRVYRDKVARIQKLGIIMAIIGIIMINF